MIKIPTKKKFESAKQLKNHMLSWNSVYNLLRAEFKNHPENKDVHIIAYKVELVDKLYYCNLRQNIRKIVNILKIYDIDSGLEKGTPESIVAKIAKIQTSKEKKVEEENNKKNKKVGYVFASKYCHFHYPERFPIFDRFASKALSKLTGNKYKNSSYEQFKKDLDEIKVKTGIEYSEIDTYLWLYGQWVFYNKKGPKNISNEFMHLVENYKQLLEDLDV